VSVLSGCFWAEDAPLPVAPSGPLPASVDVVVIGSGYTGLAAARETALAGRSTLVLDAGAIGGGCSSRNGGQVAFSFKPAHRTLIERHGRGIADAIYREGVEAVDELRRFALDEGLDCGWRESGCFVAAHTPRHFRALIEEAQTQPEGFRAPFEVVPRSRLSEAVDSPLYHGGVIYPGDASVHPQKLVVALHARALAAGADFRSHCEVLRLARRGDGWDVATGLGVVRGGRVLVATNGYTGAFSPWHQRRVFPIGSYIAATEPLDPALVARLIPHGRNFGDTRRVVIYVRPSPDGRRILFGGRASAGETDVARCVPMLARMMTEVFPALSGVHITHAWMGFVGFTFETIANVGERDGLYHAMGYCGQGVPTAPYYGRRIGRRIADLEGGDTALWNLPFATRPYYHGRPWFLPAAVQAYRVLDRLGW
jgi:glycine/D-amino acid oxidase-like deaminating enzyme